MDPDPLDEADLVVRARAGDGAAFGQLVRRYEQLVFRTAFVITGHTAEAEDAAQEGLVKAYYALGRFRAGAAFRPWLLQIVANTARNRRRASGRRVQLVLRAASAAPDSAAPSLEALALANERRDAVLAVVNQLREEDRMAIACRYFLDLSEADAAAVMGCAPGTVKSRLSRALERLRTALAQSAQAEVVRG